MCTLTINADREHVGRGLRAKKVGWSRSLPVPVKIYTVHKMSFCVRVRRSGRDDDSTSKQTFWVRFHTAGFLFADETYCTTQP